jgi:hypothetical protein
MVSNIDPTKPTYGTAYTADVRKNFATTKAEIEALQNSIIGDETQYLPLSGGTLTGDLILHGDPAIALGAATKQYVDTHPPLNGPYLPLVGGTLSGPLTLSGANPTGPLEAITKSYVDTHTQSIPDAPADSNSYGRRNLAWNQVLAVTGDVFDGGNF